MARETKIRQQELAEAGLWLRVVNTKQVQGTGTHYDENAIIELRRKGFDIVRIDPIPALPHVKED